VKWLMAGLLCAGLAMGTAQAFDADDLARLKDTGECERCDLRRADLKGLNLAGARLSRAILRDADLKDANLEGADLSQADLRRADLEKANLAGANLTAADLRNTDLE